MRCRWKSFTRDALAPESDLFAGFSDRETITEIPEVITRPHRPLLGVSSARRPLVCGGITGLRPHGFVDARRQSGAIIGKPPPPPPPPLISLKEWSPVGAITDNGDGIGARRHFRTVFRWTHAWSFWGQTVVNSHTFLTHQDNLLQIFYAFLRVFRLKKVFSFKFVCFISITFHFCSVKRTYYFENLIQSF